MRTVFLAFILFVVTLLGLTAAAPARADSEARIGADWVRISAQPCTDAAVMAAIQAAGEDPADFRAARAEFSGAPFIACWRPDFPRRLIWLRYGDGDAGLVPFAELKPVRQI